MPPKTPESARKRQPVHAHQMRDDAADRTHLAPTAPAPPAQTTASSPGKLPALGGSGMDVVGGLGGKIADAQKQQRDPTAELARVKALPPGSPELQKYIKPEALHAQVPEGAGLSGSAEQAAQSAAPQAVAAPPATVGPSVPAVKAEPAGAQVPAPDPELAKPSAAAPEATAALRQAATPPSTPAVATPTAAPPAPAPVASLAPAPAAPAKTPAAAPAADTRPAPGAELPGAAGHAPESAAPARVGQPAQGDATAGARGSAAPAPVTPAAIAAPPAAVVAPAPTSDVAALVGAEHTIADVRISPEGQNAGAGSPPPAAEPATAPGARTAPTPAAPQSAVREVPASAAEATEKAPAVHTAPPATVAVVATATALNAAPTTAPQVATAAAPRAEAASTAAVPDGAVALVSGAVPVAAAAAPAVAPQPGALPQAAEAATAGTAASPPSVQGPTPADAPVRVNAPIAAADAARAAPPLVAAATAPEMAGQARDGVADPDQARPTFGQAPLRDSPYGAPPKDGATAAAASTAQAPSPQADVRAVLGSGKPLAPNMRDHAEMALGKSLDGVRVHEGAGAETLAGQLGARAYAQGLDIVLGEAAGLADGEKKTVLAEELVHVVQMRGRPAAARGAMGVSSAGDRAEQQARGVTEEVLGGEKVAGIEEDPARKAVYRNDGPSGAPAPMPPDRVQLTLAGKTIQVRLPKLAAGTLEHMATLPDLGLPGVKLERQAQLRFSAATGQFVGGTAWATVALGKTVRGTSIKLTIGADGAVPTTLPNVALTVGKLIDVTGQARIGATGAVSSATVGAADIRDAALRKWLRDGSLDVQIDSAGKASGAGTFGVHVDPFGDGALSAHLEGEQLTGTAQVSAKAELPLGPGASAKGGQLTGELTAAGKLELRGALGVDIPALGKGVGSLNSQWSSDGEKLNGSVTYSAKSLSSLGKLAIHSADAAGTVVDGALDHVTSSGTGTFDGAFDGAFHGDFELAKNSGSFSIQGPLAQPVVQGEVTIEKGDLTTKVDADAVTAIVGRADFRLGTEMVGKATLDAGTTAKVLQATATAALVAPRTLGEVTVSKGAMSLKVQGAQVEIVGGAVDFDYRKVAAGSLNLAPSADARRLTGTGTAKTTAPQTWGDIAVSSAEFDVSMADNVAKQAQGRAEIAWAGLAKGTMAFDAQDDFNAINASASATLTKPVTLTAPLQLVPDDKAVFNIAFKSSRFDQLSGRFAWQHEGFRGDVATTQPIADLQQLSGKGRADVGAPFEIGAADGDKLMAQPGSTLAATVEAGRFAGVAGTLDWKYANWLAGEAQIPKPALDIHQIDGTLDGQVVGAHPLPRHPDVVLQPGEKGALRVAIADSKPVRYSGKLAYLFQDFLKGNVSVAGEMLSFANLQGESQAEVVGKKELPNATLLPGGKLAVTFADSGLNAFTGSAAFRYQDWLEGVATATANDGATLKTGLAGDVTASLVKPVPGNGDFAWQKGGTVKARLAPGVAVNGFATGSMLNWTSGKALGGAVTLRNDASLRGPTETSPASVLQRRELSGDPIVALLPSGGLTVELAAGSISRLSGTAAAELAGWAKGAMQISSGSTETVTGVFQGAIEGDKPLTGTQTTLVTGGNVTVPVTNNEAGGISGQIPFRYGADTGWLRGTVAGKSGGAGLNSLNGTVTGGRVTTPLDLPGGLQLKKGGNLTMPMTASQIDRIGGEANWQASDPGAAGWIGGVVALSDKSTPALVDGKWQGNIDKPLAISPTLQLMPGGGLSGQISQNAVTQLAGPVSWQIETWLAGHVDVKDVDPHQIAGEGPAQIVKPVEVIPGKLSVTPGGNFSATLANGQLVKLSGDVPFQWQDWLAGSVHAEAGTRTSLAGPVHASVIGKGTALGPVQLLPGGTLSADLKGSGVDQFEGEANVSYGKANDGSAWHIEATAAVQAASASTFRGDVTGKLASDRLLPPSLRLKRGGQLSAHVEGPALSQLSGDLGYAFAPGGTALGEGALHIAAGSSAQEISGSMVGRVVAPIHGPGIDILPGGSLSGEISRNIGVKLGGSLEVEMPGLARGRIDVAGQFDPNQAKVSGRFQASLLADRVIGPLTVQRGSALTGKVDNNVLTEVSGKLTAQVGDLRGVIDVPEGGHATLNALSGAAALQLEKNRPVGDSGLVVRAGSSLTTTVEHNQIGALHGTLGWQYADWLTGQVTADVSPDFAKVDGAATAQLAAAKPIGPLTLQPGGKLAVTLKDGKPGKLSGAVAWTYGDDAWLRGSATLQESADLASLRGEAKATLAQSKRLGEHVLLEPGGALTTRLDASQIGALTGDVIVGYDDWLRGQIHVDASRLDAISGKLDASLVRHQPFGDLTLRRGGRLQVDVVQNELKSLSGETGWQWQDGLEGNVTLQPSTPDSLSGTGTASLRQPVTIPGGIELQRGGQLQATLAANKVTSVSGDVSWRYAEWLKGNVALGGSAKAMAPTGHAQATVAQTKAFGSWTLLQGGALHANVVDGKVETLGGHAGVRWQDWLDGTLELQDGKPEQWAGRAQAGIRVAHDVGNGLTLERGGTVDVAVDAQKPLGDSPVSGHLAFTAQGWLRGEVAVTSSPLAKPTGEATATLAQDKRVGDIVLRRGGDLRATLHDGQVKAIGGTFNWQLGDWLGGTLHAETPMALDGLAGEASVTLLTQKPLAGGLNLLPGGKLTGRVAAGQIAGLAGSARYGIGGWMEGTLDLAPTQGLSNVSGAGSARVIAEKPLGAGGLKVLPGSQLQVSVAGNALGHVQGGVKWQLADWLAGTAEVNTDKLETLQGEAHARLLTEKPLAGGAKLLPGGAAEIDFVGGQPTAWGGTLGWQYGDWLAGRVTLAGKTPLTDLAGAADVRLLADKPLPGAMTLLRGGTLKATVAQGKPGALSGDLHVRYADWLEGGLHAADAALEAPSGQLTATVATNHPLAGGLTLQRGGSLKVDVQAGKVGDVAGQAAFAYQGPTLSADGTVTVQKSPLTGLAGTATARLNAPTKPVQQTTLLPGGALEVELRDGRPASLGGRVEWQHAGWLGGALELKPATPVSGPFAGEASAELLKDKSLGTRVALKAGGHVRVQMDGAQPVAQNQVSGVVTAQLDDWLNGAVTLTPGSTLQALNGSAELALLADKPLGGPLTLKKGGNVRANLKQNAVSDVSGLALLDYDHWLAGSVHLEPTADMKAVTGDATLQLQTERPLGALTLQKGGDVHARLEGGKLATFGGMVDWRYEDWLRGNLTVSNASTLGNVAGTGAAVVTAERPAGANLTIQPGGQVNATFAANKLEKVRGNLAFQWQKWLDGRVRVERDMAPESLAGAADVRTLVDKPLGANVTLLKGSRASATLENAELGKWQGAVGFRYSDFVEGRLDLEGGAALDQLKGEATVSVVKEKPLGARTDLLKGGTLDGHFDPTGLQKIHGAAAVRYDKWLTGSVTAQGEGGLEHLAGHGALRVDAEKKFGLLALRKGSVLDAEFVDSTVDLYRGNVDVAFDSWLAGNLRFEAADLADVAGEASLDVTQLHTLAGPLSILPGSHLRARMAKSAISDFGGAAKLSVRDWGNGELTVHDGSTTDHLSGSGRIDLTTPKHLGPLVTLTHGSLGAEVEANELTSVWGRADGEVKGFGTGWVAMEHGSRLDAFNGQAGIKLTTPRKIGRFGELSGGEVLANFKQNELESFGGKADITLYGWGKGSVQIDAGSTLESLKGAATLKLTEPRSLAGGKVKITGGEVSALVDGQALTQVAGQVELELPGIARGKVGGQLDLAKDTFSGQGTLQQIKPWSAGPAKVTDATLAASIVDGRLASASGSAQIDAGKLGRGAFQVNYEDTGNGPLLYGAGEVQFQPHDRVKGKLDVAVSRDQKLTGRGELDVKISENIHGKAAAALDADGHVKLAGGVTIPGPFELFKPAPWKKDLKLLNASILVYTPPNVKVKVGAGLGLEVGLKPLTVRNLSLGGEVDLMDPSFAAMSVAGQLSSAAYADLNVYLEGSVEVSAVVVAVNAGLRAALNLHLEAAIDARPTMTVNKRGLGFDMPVDARLSAALNLILTFFAKVKVGLDLGVVSVMETVWQYDKSPDPLKLGDYSLGAKGRVTADAGGMRGSMKPEYKPPNLSIETLKKALKL